MIAPKTVRRVRLMPWALVYFPSFVMTRSVWPLPSNTAPARYAAVHGHLSVMTGRRVSQIVRQADCPDQCRIRKPFPDIVIIVPAMIVMQSVPDGLAYLADLPACA